MVWSFVFYKLCCKNTNLYDIRKKITESVKPATQVINIPVSFAAKSKETILATRMAGFDQPLYEYLGLKLVSYSVYENPFEILEIPVQNPISNYGRRLYTYKLIDTVSIAGRKAFRIYFQPKKFNGNKLRGLLYIDAETYAISKAYYRIYGVVNIHATYTFSYLKEQQLWFPEKRFFKVQKGNNYDDINLLGGTIKFSSSLDFKERKNATDQVYLYLESTPFDVEINKPIIVSKPTIKIEVPATSLKKSMH